MNDLYQNMLSSYDCTTEQRKRNAIFEVNQQIVLEGLYRGGFFNTAAFYGGTCLRIFHGLNRFSEAMDFSLITPDEYVVFFTRFVCGKDARIAFPKLEKPSKRARLVRFRVVRAQQRAA